jgi:hypothetical protein
MTDFISTLLNTGIDPGGQLVAGGPPKRATCSCSPHKKNRNGNGWYLYYPDTPAIITWGCWKEDCPNSSGGSYSPKSDRTPSPEEREAIKARMEAIRREREEERQRIEAATREKAARLCGKGRDVSADHPYIVNGGITPKGISQLKEMLLIPMSETGTGTPASLQLIFPDGTKRFLTGTGAIPGPLYHVIKGTGSILYVVEGWKTGMSVHEATGANVVVAFSSGRLPAVAEALRKQFPKREIVIAGDFGNGSGKAIEAARRISGKVIIPVMPEGVTGTDWNDIHKAVGLPEVARQLVTAAAPIEEEPPQPETEAEEAEPLPIEQRRFAVRPFPFGILPEPFIRLVTEYATALQVQPEIITMQMMTVVSGTIGNSIVLQIKRGWETPPFLWTAIIGDTGSGKSHSGEAIIQPVKEQQAREATRHKKLMEEYQLELAAYKADKKHNAIPKEPPPMLHYYTTNFTIEALIPMYQADARGLIIHVDELAGLFRGLNQYKASGNDQEQLLSLFNATDIKADRKSGSGYVRNSGAAVIGGIQNGILSQVFGESDYVNGMAYRVLPVVMDSTPPRFTMDSISRDATETWKGFIDWTYQIPLEIDPESGRIKPLKLTLEPAALEAWRLFHDHFAEAEPFVSTKFRGYLPKLRTYCLKFMSILHVMECYRHDTLATVVSVGTVNNSVLLTEYYAGQALQLIRGAAVERNPYHVTLHKALDSLQGDVSGGRLLLSSIRDRMNEMLPVDMQVEATQNKRLATWLKEIGLTVTKRADNKSVVSLS